MTNTNKSIQQPVGGYADIIIKLGLLFILIIWCFRILYPFASVLLWGIVIAISIFPLYRSLEKLVSNKAKIAAALFTVILLGIVLIPGYAFMRSMASGLSDFGNRLKNNELLLPPANPEVQEWPLVGNQIYDVWELVKEDAEAALIEYKEEVKQLGQSIISFGLGIGRGILMFAFAIVISGVLLAHWKQAQEFAQNLFKGILGDQGEEFTDLAAVTVKNVTKGILGVAVIQTALLGLGMWFAGVPYTGVWTFIILMLAIVQVPTLLVIIPVVVFLFSTTGALPAVLWSICLLLVSISDNFLKPIFFGKGTSVPTMVVFLGAIGGMMLTGFLGLFTGAIVLTLGYKLFINWVRKVSKSPNVHT